MIYIEDNMITIPTKVANEQQEKLYMDIVMLRSKSLSMLATDRDDRNMLDAVPYKLIARHFVLDGNDSSGREKRVGRVFVPKYHGISNDEEIGKAEDFFRWASFLLFYMNAENINLTKKTKKSSYENWGSSTDAVYNMANKVGRPIMIPSTGEVGTITFSGFEAVDIQKDNGDYVVVPKEEFGEGMLDAEVTIYELTWDMSTHSSIRHYEDMEEYGGLQKYSEKIIESVKRNSRVYPTPQDILSNGGRENTRATMAIWRMGADGESMTWDEWRLYMREKHRGRIESIWPHADFYQMSISIYTSFGIKFDEELERGINSQIENSLNRYGIDHTISELVEDENDKGVSRWFDVEIDSEEDMDSASYMIEEIAHSLRHTIKTRLKNIEVEEKDGKIRVMVNYVKEEYQPHLDQGIMNDMLRRANEAKRALEKVDYVYDIIIGEPRSDYEESTQRHYVSIHMMWMNSPGYVLDDKPFEVKK